MSEHEAGPGGGTRFDPSRYLRQLRGREGTAEYLDVKWRLVWLRAEHPDAQITTEHVTITSEMAIFKAQVTIPNGGSATGYGSETARDFTDFIEKAETKALGRALIALGYGTQFAQEAGEDEIVEATPVRPTPAPPEPTPARAVAPRAEPPVPARAGPPSPATPPAVLSQPAAPPVAATVPRAVPAPTSPRPEPIPVDARRPAPMRPLRDQEPERPVALAASAPPVPVSIAVATMDEDEDEGEAIFGLPSRAPEAAPPTPVPVSPRPGLGARLSPPQAVPRPTPRPTPAPTARGDSILDGEDEEIDMANYGWTEFWSWARARGFNDRKSLDAVVGRPTNGMTPLEIRKYIQAKQG